MAAKDDLLLSARLMYPNGQAFEMPVNGISENLHKGIIGDTGVDGSLVKLYEDAHNIIDLLIPDNDNWTLQDCIDWYRRLGLIYNGVTDIPTLKAAILQKMSWAANPLNQQTAAFIQAQLVAAGFTTASVTFNNYGPGGEAASPMYTLSNYNIEAAMCNLVQSGDTQCGTAAGNSISPSVDLTVTKVANYIEESKDFYVRLFPDYRSTFYIVVGGSIPLARKEEFRQLIIKLKAQQMVAWLITEWV